jgi:hypothetical protein
MTEYQVTVGFWLRAYDRATIVAPNDAEILTMAKTVAIEIMGSSEKVDTVDFDERREGTIIFVDRVTPRGNEEVHQDIAFDDDHIHPASHNFVEKISILPTDIELDDAGKAEALRQYFTLIAEAKRLRGDAD